MVATMSRQDMTSILQKGAEVSTVVLGMMNNLAGIDIRKFVPPGDTQFSNDQQLVTVVVGCVRRCSGARSQPHDVPKCRYHARRTGFHKSRTCGTPASK